MAPSKKAGPTQMTLFEAWMDTTRWLLTLTERFPKSRRHTLTERIESVTLEILEGLTSAAWTRDKGALLARADDGLSRLRVLVRLGHELRLLSHDQYEEAARRFGEAGRMIGGWRASAGKRGGVQTAVEPSDRAS